MNESAEKALRYTRLDTDGRDYLVVHLPPASITAAAGIVAEIGESFQALIVDEHEVTLIIPAEALESFARRIPGFRIIDHPYRLITLDSVLEPDLVGYMAEIGATLAKAGVPILPMAAFSRDHVLVPAVHLERAMAALSERIGKGSR